MVEASVPSPRTWSPNDLVTAPRLRADVSNAVAFMTGKPLLVVQRTLGDSWPTATVQGVPWDTELADSWNGHLAPPSSGTGPYWCQAAGWYLCDVRIPWAAASSGGAYQCGFQGESGGVAFGPTSGAIATAGTGGAACRAMDLIQLAVPGVPGGAGDWIQAVAAQYTGAAVSFSASASSVPTMIVRWVSLLSGTTGLPLPPLAAAPKAITSAWLNANARDTIAMLARPPLVKAKNISTGGLANSSVTAPATIPMNTLDADTWGAYTTGSEPYFTAPVAGRYLLAGQFNLAAASAAGTYACGVSVNGTVSWGDIMRFSGGGVAAGAGVVKRVRLNAGDRAALVGAQNTGAAIEYSQDYVTQFLVLWEGS